MALNDMIEKESQRKAQEELKNQELIAAIPSAIEKRVSNMAETLYDEICQTIASVFVSNENQSQMRDFVKIPDNFGASDARIGSIHLPQDLVSTYGIKICQPEYSYEGTLLYPGGFSITVYHIEYSDNIVLGKRCRLDYFNHTIWNMLYTEIKKKCDPHGIVLEPVCMVELDNDGTINKRHGLNDAYRIKWHSEIGGGWPEYKQIVALPFIYSV